MEREVDWSWLQQPEYVVPYLAAMLAVGLVLASPLRRVIGRDLSISVAGVLVGLVGWALQERGEMLAALGVILAVFGVWLALGAPGTGGWIAGAMPEDDGQPREVDHSVAPHDIDDPETAKLYDPEEMERLDAERE